MQQLLQPLTQLTWVLLFLSQLIELNSRLLVHNLDGLELRQETYKQSISGKLICIDPKWVV